MKKYNFEFESLFNIGNKVHFEQKIQTIIAIDFKVQDKGGIIIMYSLIDKEGHLSVAYENNKDLYEL